jgi:hypothetical protein
MTLVLNRIIWDDGFPSLDPEDYRIIDETTDKAIGRIYRSQSSGATRRLWFTWWVPPKGQPNNGTADTLESAKAAIRRAWDARLR